MVLGMRDIVQLLERWHALWLLALGWTASAVAEALERDSHTIGMWVTALARIHRRRGSG